MNDGAFKKLCDDLDKARKKKSKARNAVIIAAGKNMADKHEESEEGQLTKALTSAAPIIGSKAACHLDLLHRQGKLPTNVRSALPTNVRSALLTINTNVSAAAPCGN